MKRLNLSREATWVDVDPELRVLLRPLRRMELARLLAEGPAEGERAAANAVAARLRSAVNSRDVAVHLALGAVEDWTVVDDQTGDRLPVTLDVAEALFDDAATAAAFVQAVLAALLPPAEALETEKNASAPSPNGSSAGARTTAAPATASAPTARRAPTSRRRSKAKTSGG